MRNRPNPANQSSDAIAESFYDVSHFDDSSGDDVSTPSPAPSAPPSKPVAVNITNDNNKEAPAVKDSWIITDDSARQIEFILQPHKEIQAQKEQDKKALVLQAEFNRKWRTKEKPHYEAYTYLVAAGSLTNGVQLEPGQAWITTMNNAPLLTIYEPNVRRRDPQGSINTTFNNCGVFNINDTLYGAGGTYVINVEPGYYFKAWKNNQAILLAPGMHVIHDATFELKFEDKGQARKLEGHELTEVIKNKKFSFEKFLVSQNEDRIEHGNIRVLFVPNGQVAKVRIDKKHYLLPHKDEPWIFQKNLFDFNGFEKVSEPYIEWGSKHYVQVPRGKVVLAWRNNIPEILEHQEKPYLIDDFNFRIDKTQDGKPFHDATEEVIKHGSTLRLIVTTGRAAVVSINGSIRIFESSATPHFIENGKFECWFDTNVRQKIFPSAQEIEEHTKAQQKYPAFKIVLLKDSWSIGVKLNVEYQVDPNGVLASNHHLADIDRRVENKVSPIVIAALRTCDHNSFLSADVSNISHPPFPQHQVLSDNVSPSAPPIELTTHLDRLKQELKTELHQMGINLRVLNICEFVIVDEAVKEQLNKAAIQSLTQHSELDRQYLAQRIAQNQNQIEAENKTAEIQRRQMEQQTQLTFMQAQAKLMQENPLFAMFSMVQAASTSQNPAAAQMTYLMMQQMPTLLAQNVPANSSALLSNNNNAMLVLPSAPTNKVADSQIIEEKQKATAALGQ